MLSHQPAGRAGFFSSAKRLTLLPGTHISPGRVAGYYIDLRLKTHVAEWPPPWLDRPRMPHVAACQWGLGAYEHYLAGEGDQWLTAAIDAGRYLLRSQTRGGRDDGGWPHNFSIHTYRLVPPWLSAMAQGEGASLLTRLFLETDEEQFADAAVRALRPLSVSTEDGGVQTRLADGPFLEEYPTNPPSFVLNGAFFSLWGCYDVWVGMSDSAVGRMFEDHLTTLCQNLYRWDTSYWSRYDLYPHPVVNVASSAYHLLHRSQLRAMNLIAPRSELADTLARFERYAASRPERTRAHAQKVLFRLLVPRNKLLARFRMSSGAAAELELLLNLIQ